MNQKIRKTLLFLFGFAAFIALVQIIGSFARLPEWNAGYFYLIEGQLRVFIPIAVVSLALFLAALVIHLCLSRKENKG